MTSQPGKQTIAILPNISRSKGNRIMKFGFYEKWHTKYGAKTISRPYSKKSKLKISFDQKSKVLYLTGEGLLKYTQTKLKTTCYNFMQSFFKKQKDV